MSAAPSPYTRAPRMRAARRRPGETVAEFVAEADRWYGRLGEAWFDDPTDPVEADHRDRWLAALERAWSRLI